MATIEEQHANQPGVVPPLDPEFVPMAIATRSFAARVKASGQATPLVLAVERGPGMVSRYETAVFGQNSPHAVENLPLVERLLKTLLWSCGGARVYVGGPRALGEALQAIYSPTGARAFDVDTMACIYEQPFTVVPCSVDDVPAAAEPSHQIGGHLAGCRIGLDLGASDRKVAAVLDGEPVYVEEVVWDPRPQTNPEYHFNEIMTALRTAAAHLPRVDAIGVSSAGVYVNNRVRIASLFRGVPAERFTPEISDIFFRVRQAWNGVPLDVINDGDVTALSGAMALGDTAVLGIALGSSEAGGYVTPEGRLTSRLNELAFLPIDLQADAPVDEWSGDRGCGAQYLSQQAVFRLAERLGISLAEHESLADKLKYVQSMLQAGDERAVAIWQTIGAYLGYAIAHYADIYDLRHLLILGRVTSGDGGSLLLDYAQRVLRQDFPELAARLSLHLPDEKTRRVGQAVAASSLSVIA